MGGAATGRCAICCARQAGHQHPAASPAGGNATTGGKRVHQHGAPSLPSTMAQPNAAPQRVQILMRCLRLVYPYVSNLNGEHQKIQHEASIMPTAAGYCL
jgi:hypothetical protein